MNFITSLSGLALVLFGSIISPTTIATSNNMFDSMSTVDMSVSRGCVDGRATIACLVKHVSK